MAVELQLNTASSVDIRYGDKLRQVILHRGEIQISTAADARARPFIVHTPEGSIRALGTRFGVRSLDGVSWVGVQASAVEVRAADRLNFPLRLDAGQSVRFSAAQAGEVEPLTDSSDAWTRNLLIVSDWRLDRFIAELSRYQSGYLGCDNRAASLRISGAFNLANIPALLKNLEASLPVKTRSLTRYWTRLEAL